MEEFLIYELRDSRYTRFADETSRHTIQVRFIDPTYTPHFNSIHRPHKRGIGQIVLSDMDII